MAVVLSLPACKGPAPSDGPLDAANGEAVDAATAEALDAARDDLTLPADASQVPDAVMAPDGDGAAARFAVAVAPGWHMLYYQYGQLEPAVDALAPPAFTIHLTGADVSRYRVEKQPSPRVEIVLTAGAADRIRRDPDYGHDLYSAYFDMRFDGARKYVAIGWDRIGQAAIQAPVVHTETVNGQLVLRVGAVQGAWYGWGNYGAGDGRVDPAALRAYFQARGQLEVVNQLTP